MRIAIVNDMPMAMEGLRRAVQDGGRHDIAWMAWNGREAVERCARDVPDIILMDLIMPEVNGIEATSQIMRSTPCPILIVTASIDQNCSMVFEAMGKGALDAVNTPMLGMTGTGEGRDALLKKIEQIGILKCANGVKVHHPAPVSSVRDEVAASEECLVVIGSSSGGPQALAACIQKLPADFPSPIVIVQHVDAHFAPGLAHWLDEQTPLSVRLAQEGDRPAPGTVLIAGRNDHLILKGDGSLAYTETPKETPYRPSVDVFWNSVSQHWRGPVVAILLTGMGRDGAKGMLELRRGGAYTIAQDEQTSAVYGMPKAAKELGAVVEILPIQQIAPALCRKLHHYAGD
jgi:two-component system response regulator WspF